MTHSAIWGLFVVVSCQHFVKLSREKVMIYLRMASTTGTKYDIGIQVPLMLQPTI